MTPKESKRQVALLGAGRIGVVRARALSQLHKVQLKYVMDVDDGRCEALVARLGGSVRLLTTYSPIPKYRRPSLLRRRALMLN